MTFKAQVLSDIENVFINLNEFGEECTIIIGSTEIAAHIVRDDDTLRERSDSAAQGIYLGEKLIFIKAETLPGRPAIGSRLTLDGKAYMVNSCVESMGLYELRVGANKT